MGCQKTDDFLPDGQRRILKTEEYEQRCDEIRASVTAKYHGQYTQAHFFKRLLIRMRMEHEIEREIEKLAPRRAMYLRATRRVGPRPTQSRLGA